MIEKILLKIPASSEEDISDALFDSGAMSVSASAENGGILLDVLADSGTADAIMAAFSSFNPSRTVLEEKDWVNEWASDFSGGEICPGVLIVPEGMVIPRYDGIVIRLDPKDAFGAGTHPTTRLCGAALCVIMREKLFGNVTLSFLDAGTGTGILALLAAALGAVRIEAFDIDPAAAESARRNAAMNGCGGIHVVCSGIDEFICEEPFDCVCANVNSVIIESCFMSILGFIRAKGLLILSGIGEQWGSQMETLFESSGLGLLNKTCDSGWLCYILKKR